MNTTPTENKQLIARYLQALSVQGKTTEIVARFVSEPGLAAHIKDVESAFPQYQLVAEELIAERDLVAMRATFHGVHKGAFVGIAATGRPVSAGLMITYRIDGGRIAQHWKQFDMATLMAQLTESIAMRA